MWEKGKKPEWVKILEDFDGMSIIAYDKLQLVSLLFDLPDRTNHDEAYTTMLNKYKELMNLLETIELKLRGHECYDRLNERAQIVTLLQNYRSKTDGRARLSD